MANSGKGWQMFKLEGKANVGIVKLKSHAPLDYENKEYSHYFRFRVEVTDQVM